MTAARGDGGAFIKQVALVGVAALLALAGVGSSALVGADEAPDSSAIPADDPVVPEFVEGSLVAIYQNYIPWFLNEAKNEKALTLLGKDFAVRPISALKTGIPSDTRIVIIASASLGNTLNQIADEVDPAAQANLDAFVKGGGVLVTHLGDNNIGFPTAYKVPGLLDTADDLLNCTGLTIVDSTHPLVLGPDGIAGTFDDLDNNKIDAQKQPVPSAAGDPFAPGGPFCSDNHGSLAGILPAGAQVVLREEGGKQRPVWAQYPLGRGHVIVTTLTLEFFRHQFQTLVNELHVAQLKLEPKRAPRPLGPPISPPAGPTISRPVSPQLSPPISPPISPPVSPPISPPAGPPISAPECPPPVSPPISPSLSPPISPPISPPMSPPVSPPVSPPTPTVTGATTRVSVDSAGNQGNSFSEFAAISGDGRFVAFASAANNLVAGDTNGARDVFVHDRQTGVTTRVSVDGAGNQGNGGSFRPAISGDGRFVAFDSSADNLAADDTNGAFDVFVHDRQTGVTTRVSVDSAGNQGNGGSFVPAISGDGRFVAFKSFASNLVAADTNGAADIFIHDRKTSATARVSVDSAGNQGNDVSGRFGFRISGDGRFVAFESDASNLVAADTNGATDVFVHDRKTSATTRVSVDGAGNQGNGGSFGPAISADGRFVAFYSSADNLAADDTNGAFDIFVHDRQTGVTSRVSVDSAGNQGNGGSFHLAMSGDGRFIAFRSDATNLVAEDSNGAADVFVHDRQTGATTRVSVDSAGNQGNGDSFLPAVSGDGLSGDGRFVAFESDASNLVAGDTNGTRDVFIHDRSPGISPPVSPGVSPPISPPISPPVSPPISPPISPPECPPGHTLVSFLTGTQGLAATAASAFVLMVGAAAGFMRLAGTGGLRGKPSDDE